MKQIFFLICVSLQLVVAAQSSQWAWIHGDSTGNNIDVYSQIDAADPSNKPGAFIPFNTWTDGEGNLWMFSGRHYIIRFGTETIPVSSSQLWKYNTFSNAWTMVKGGNGRDPDDGDAEGVYGIKGIFDSLNTPPKFRQGGAVWTDTTGKFWLFGGKIGYRDYGSKNDLWQFDPVINQWMWVSGEGRNAAPLSGAPSYGTKGVTDSMNHPGARSEMVYWKDRHGNFYLYGGVRDITHTVYSDLWKYQPSINRWTWIGGTSSPGNLLSPVYGIKGIPADSISPGALSSRTTSVFSWTDPLGKVWIYTGTEFWSYLPETNQWTWIDGKNSVSQPRIMGVKGKSSPENNPGSRSGSAKMVDTSGNLWIYGGQSGAYFDDLWKYTLSSGQWTWMGGDSSVNRPPDFGTKGIAAITNQPGNRAFASAWNDAKGNFWLFGGQRTDTQGVSTLRLNDLWKLTTPAENVLAIKLQEFTAYLQNEHVVITWHTSFEQNSKEFLIQYSTDGAHFTTIGTVAASNLMSGSYYGFKHKQTSTGNNFYRLQQVNEDGTYEYSSIINVVIKKQDFSYNLVQNPAHNNLIIEMQAQQVTTLEITISDIPGNQLIKDHKTIVAGRSMHFIPLAQLSPGFYFISIMNDKQLITKRFFKS